MKLLRNEAASLNITTSLYTLNDQINMSSRLDPTPLLRSGHFCVKFDSTREFNKTKI